VAHRAGRERHLDTRGEATLDFFNWRLPNIDMHASGLIDGFLHPSATTRGRPGTYLSCLLWARSLRGPQPPILATGQSAAAAFS